MSERAQAFLFFATVFWPFFIIITIGDFFFWNDPGRGAAALIYTVAIGALIWIYRSHVKEIFSVFPEIFQSIKRK